MNNISKGYKQTEVGVIPSDWEVKKLGEIADIDPDNLSSLTDPSYSFNYISFAPGFIYNHFFSFIIGKQIETLITGSNYPAINSKDVKSLLIPLPPTKA